MAGSIGRAQRRDILGVPVGVLDADEALAVLNGALTVEGEPVSVAFANAHAVNLAARDARFRDALRGALVLCDGVGVDLAGRALHGSPFPANLNGTDFVPLLLEHAERPLRIAMLGARPPRLLAARAALEARFPRHQIVASIHGYREAAREAETVREIARSRPDLLLVALGNPAQELWLDRHLSATGARVGMGVGALFDFLSGDVRRAPRIVRRVRAEWAWRLALEPRRMAHRYLVGNAVFLARVALARRRGSAVSVGGGLEPGQADHGGERVADLHKNDRSQGLHQHAEPHALRDDHEDDDDQRAPAQGRSGYQADEQCNGNHSLAPGTYDDAHSTLLGPHDECPVQVKSTARADVSRVSP